MNKQKFVKHLVEHGCFLYRQGREHEYWRSADGDLGSRVPRHKEIKTPTARAICRDLGIPIPRQR